MNLKNQLNVLSFSWFSKSVQESLFFINYVISVLFLYQVAHLNYLFCVDINIHMHTIYIWVC